MVAAFYFSLLCFSLVLPQEREDRQLRYSEILQRPFAVNLQAIIAGEDRDLHSGLLLSALTGRAIGLDYLNMVWSDPRSRSMYDVLSTNDDTVRRKNLQLIEKSFIEELGVLKQQVTDAAEKGMGSVQTTRLHALRVMLFLLEEFGTVEQFERHATEWSLLQRSLKKEYPKVGMETYGHLYMFNLYALKLEKQKRDNEEIENSLQALCEKISKEFDLTDATIDTKTYTWVNPFDTKKPKGDPTFRHMQLGTLNGELDSLRDTPVSNAVIHEIRCQLLPKAKNYDSSIDSLKKWIKALTAVSA